MVKQKKIPLHRSVKTFNTLAARKGNVWVTALVVLLLLLGFALLNRASLTGLSSGASNTVSLKLGEEKTVTAPGGQKVNMEYSASSTARAWFFGRSTRTAEIKVSTADVPAEERTVKLQPGKAAPVGGDSSAVITLKQATETEAKVTITEPSGKIQSPPLPPISSSGTPGIGGSGGSSSGGSGSGPTAGQFVSSPIATSSWPVCSLQTIKWNQNAVSSAGVGIFLLKNNQKVLEVAWPKTVKNPNGTVSTSGGLLRNNGGFDWIVPCELAVGSDYKIQIVDGGARVLAESAQFGIAAKAGAVNIIAPRVAQIVPYGQDFLVKWFPPKTAFSGAIDIAIYNKDLGYNGLGFIVKNLPKDAIYVDAEGNGGFTWSVYDGVILDQANGNAPTTIKGDNVCVIIATVDRSVGTPEQCFKVR